jgi:hypothetical protein
MESEEKQLTRETKVGVYLQGLAGNDISKVNFAADISLKDRVFRR